MLVHIFPLLGFVLAAILLFITYFFWRKSLTYHKALLQYVESEKSHIQKQKSMDKSTKRLQELLDTENQKLAKEIKKTEQLTASIEKSEEATKEHQKELQAKLENASSKAEHFEEMCQSLTKQLQQLDQEKAAEKKQATDTLNTKLKSARGEVNSLKEQLKEAKASTKEQSIQLQKKTKDFKKLEEKSKSGDPEEVKKLKFKLKQYQHFYSTIQGQKEMLEERNHNWETALKLLSTWILKSRNKEVSPNIGTLVSSALELTKSGPLVNDEEADDITFGTQHDETANTLPQ